VIATGTQHSVRGVRRACGVEARDSPEMGRQGGSRSTRVNAASGKKIVAVDSRYFPGPPKWTLSSAIPARPGQETGLGKPKTTFEELVDEMVRRRSPQRGAGRSLGKARASCLEV